MEILTDNTIDEMTAKYFCIFASSEIQQYLKNVNDEDKIIDTAENLVQNNNKNLNEGAADWIKSKVSNAKNSVEDMAKATVQKTTATTAQAAVDTVTSAANQQKLADTASKAASKASGAAVDSAIEKLEQNRDTLNSLAKDASSSATQGAIDTLASNNATLNKLSQDAGASATKGAIDTLAANQQAVDAAAQSAGSAATRGALNTLKGAASSALSAAMPWLIGAAVTTLGAALWPKIKGGFKRMFRTSAKAKNSLAYVKFKDTDDNDWQFYFSKDKLLWRLDKMNSGEDVPKHNIVAFMQTQFAKNFMARCQSFVTKVLDSEVNLNVLYQQQINDKDAEGKQFLEYLAKNKKSVYSRMFSGKC